MKSSVEFSVESKTDNDVEPADDWENDESESAMQNQLQERFRQVKILQREKADKHARIEKARQDEAISKSAKSEASSNPQSLAVMPVKMQIMRRPKSDDQLDEAARAKKEQEEKERAKKPTLEERQAAYEIARNRILGSNYKPEPATAAAQSTTSPVSRNRSPEQILVRRPSPDNVFIPCYQGPLPSYPASQNCGYPQYAPNEMNMPMNYGVAVTTAQSFMPYIDTSRPPPLINTMAGPSVSNFPQQIPTYGTGQYFGGDGQFIPQQGIPPNCVPYGRPPVSVYPPGTLGAAMQVTMDSGQSQAQRKNRHNKKKHRNPQETADAVH